MKTILQVDFPFSGPFDQEMAQAMAGLAHSINEEPGFIWKIWTENAAQEQAGGVYLFENEVSAQQYLKKHTARLEEAGVTGIRGRIFAVNEALSAVNKAPL
ncbi:monooxygenase [Oceanimonas smirnovii]|uniref:monooxygenase n=1 Tax=Oceanimonas smirnovii TaxID=264574 RepID=UPI003770126E